MAEFVEFKSKEDIEAEAKIDEIIRQLMQSGDIKPQNGNISLVEKPEFDQEKIQNVQSCLDFMYDLLEGKSKTTVGNVDVKFCSGSKTNVVIKSKLKSMHIDNVSDFINKFVKADNIDIYPLNKGKQFEFDVKFNHAATPVPAGKDGADNE